MVDYVPPLALPVQNPLTLLLQLLGRPSDTRPRLTAIYHCAAAGEPLIATAQAEVVSGKGLLGDRYSRDAGFWHRVDSCQLTLITEHELARVRRAGTVTVDSGQHRRNLVVAGVTPKQLAGRSFQIGDALFAYHKPRPPCGYIDTVAGKGMAKALGRHSGACLKVIRGGSIRVGDALVWQSDISASA
jgi:MOSC domain-containing protein YiiM